MCVLGVGGGGAEGVSTANYAKTGVSSETARPRVPLQNPN